MSEGSQTNWVAGLRSQDIAEKGSTQNHQDAHSKNLRDVTPREKDSGVLEMDPNAGATATFGGWPAWIDVIGSFFLIFNTSYIPPEKKHLLLTNHLVED
jgi:hypothetical protein